VLREWTSGECDNCINKWTLSHSLTSFCLPTVDVEVYCWTWSHSLTHHALHDSSGRGISPLQRPLPENVEHSQETDIHAPGETRTLRPIKRGATNPHLRPRGQRGRRKQPRIVISKPDICQRRYFPKHLQFLYLIIDKTSLGRFRYSNLGGPCFLLSFDFYCWACNKTLAVEMGVFQYITTNYLFHSVSQNSLTIFPPSFYVVDSLYVLMISSLGSNKFSERISSAELQPLNDLVSVYRFFVLVRWCSCYFV
jgi:hypothetical protein